MAIPISIPVEVFKAGVTALIQKLTEPCKTMWPLTRNSEAPPLFISIGERKTGSPAITTGGFPSLSCPAKFMSGSYLNRLIQHKEDGNLPRNPVWIQRHDIRGKTTAGEMSRTEQRPLHNIRRPHIGLSHSQSCWTVKDHGDVRLSWKVHHGALVSRRYPCSIPGRRRTLRRFPNHQWSHTRLRVGPHEIQHDVFCYAVRYIFRWWCNYHRDQIRD